MCRSPIAVLAPAMNISKSVALLSLRGDEEFPAAVLARPCMGSQDPARSILAFYRDQSLALLGTDRGGVGSRAA